MKTLKKLALVTAVAAVGSSAYALEKLDDKELAQATGQDGITITISPDNTVGVQIDKLLIHDNDGVPGVPAGSSFTATELGISAATTGTAGAIVLDTGAKDKNGTATTKGLIIQGGDIAIGVDTDGGGTGNKPFINANIQMSGETHIGIGKVQVGKSGAVNAAGYTGAAQRGTDAAVTSQDILGALSLKMNGGEMNVQLGEQPQGAMVKMKSTLTGGLKLNDLEVIDANGHGATPTAPRKGSLLVKEVVLTDATGPNMSMNATVDIDSEKGIVIGMKSPTGGYYAYLTDVGIGDGTGTGTMATYDVTSGTPPVTTTLTSTIGDVEIIGLSMGDSTISIKGH